MSFVQLIVVCFLVAVFTTYSGKIVVSHLTERPSNLIKLKNLLNYLFVCFFFIQFSMTICCNPFFQGYLVGSSGLASLSNVPRSTRSVEALGLSLLIRPCATSWVALVGSSGLEPPTSRLSGARSNHLSYEPMCFCGVSLPSRSLWWR